MLDRSMYLTNEMPQSETAVDEELEMKECATAEKQSDFMNNYYDALEEMDE